MNKLREARERAGISQVELGKRAGISQSSVSDLERGVVEFPPVDTATLIARALGVLVEDVFPVPDREMTAGEAA